MLSTFVVISAADDVWLAVVINLAKAQAVWRWLVSILIREGAMPRISGFFLKDVVHLVLIIGAETWVVTPRMGQVLGGFQHKVDRQFTGRILWQRTDKNWEYALAAAAREEVGFDTMEEYIQRRQNTAAQFIDTRFLLDLYGDMERTPRVFGGGIRQE